MEDGGDDWGKSGGGEFFFIHACSVVDPKLFFPDPDPTLTLI
jgi:hypothetical protein